MFWFLRSRPRPLTLLGAREPPLVRRRHTARACLSGPHPELAADRATKAQDRAIRLRIRMVPPIRLGCLHLAPRQRSRPRVPLQDVQIRRPEKAVKNKMTWEDCKPIQPRSGVVYPRQKLRNHRSDGVWCGLQNEMGSGEFSHLRNGLCCSYVVQGVGREQVVGGGGDVQQRHSAGAQSGTAVASCDSVKAVPEHVAGNLCDLSAHGLDLGSAGLGLFGQVACPVALGPLRPGGAIFQRKLVATNTRRLAQPGFGCRSNNAWHSRTTQSRLCIPLALLHGGTKTR